MRAILPYSPAYKDNTEPTFSSPQAAYELFSPLSFDYDEIQEAVFDFFKKNWVRRYLLSSLFFY